MINFGRNKSVKCDNKPFSFENKIRKFGQMIQLFFAEMIVIHGIRHKWHSKIFLGSGKFVKKLRQILPLLRNLPNSGIKSFHKIGGVKIIAQKWRFGQNRWVKHPPLSILGQKCHDLCVFSGKIGKFGNGVKHLTKPMSVVCLWFLLSC